MDRLESAIVETAIAFCTGGVDTNAALKTFAGRSEGLSGYSVRPDLPQGVFRQRDLSNFLNSVNKENEVLGSGLPGCVMPMKTEMMCCVAFSNGMSRPLIVVGLVHLLATMLF